MPVVLRYFNIRMLIEQKEREKSQAKEAESEKPSMSPKGVPQRPMIKKPF